MKSLLKLLLVSVMVTFSCFGKSNKWEEAYQNGSVAFEKGNYQVALKEFKKSYYESKNFMVCINIGNCYSYLGDLKSALSEYSKAIDGAKTTWAPNDPKYAYIYYNIGYAYENVGDAEKAIENYKMATKVDSTYPDAKEKCQILLGGIAFSKGMYAEAKMHYSNGLRLLDPSKTVDRISCFSERSLCFAEMGIIDSALNDVDNAIKLGLQLVDEKSPQIASMYNRRGYANERGKKYVEARKDYEKSVELNSESTSAYENLLWLLSACPDKSQINPKQALDKMSLLIKLKGSDTADIYPLMATVYAANGQFKEAVRLQTIACERNIGDSTENKERLQLFKSGKPFVDNQKFIILKK